MDIRKLWVVTILALATLFPRQAAAEQQASSFEQLQVLVKTGDAITVSDTRGEIIKGKISDLSTSSLRLLVKGGVREFSQADVLEIRKRRSDSLANGAITGALVAATISGLGVGLICASDDVSCDAGTAVAAVGVYSGLGAAIGVGIDALFRFKQTIFSPRRPTSGINVAPLVSSRLRGVQVGIRF